MPIYRYICFTCNQRFDLRCPIKDRHEQKCPDCDGKAVLKMSPVTRIWGKTGKPEGA